VELTVNEDLALGNVSSQIGNGVSDVCAFLLAGCLIVTGRV
jgi:hypothetical protein